MNIIYLAIISFYISFQITELSGIGKIFKKLRERTKENTWLPFNCFYCMNLIVSLLLSFLTDNWILYWLVITTISIFIYLIHEVLYNRKDV